MNDIRVTVHGNVVNDPITRPGRNGSVFTTFRVGTTPYRRNGDGKFVDLDTSFYNVIAFNVLAANAGRSLLKGQPVVIEGKLSSKSYIGSDGVSRTSSEIEADHIGHDLRWGRASFLRLSKAAALGLDPASEVEVRNAVATMDGGAGAGSEPVGFGAGRPANVDANGVLHGDLALGEGEPGSAEDLGHDDVTGDPESDDYTVEEPAA